MEDIAELELLSPVDPSTAKERAKKLSVLTTTLANFDEKCWPDLLKYIQSTDDHHYDTIMRIAKKPVPTAASILVKLPVEIWIYVASGLKMEDVLNLSQVIPLSFKTIQTLLQQTRDYKPFGIIDPNWCLITPRNDHIDEYTVQQVLDDINLFATYNGDGEDYVYRVCEAFHALNNNQNNINFYEVIHMAHHVGHSVTTTAFKTRFIETMCSSSYKDTDEHLHLLFTRLKTMKILLSHFEQVKTKNSSVINLVLANIMHHLLKAVMWLLKRSGTKKTSEMKEIEWKLDYFMVEVLQWKDAKSALLMSAMAMLISMKTMHACLHSTFVPFGWFNRGAMQRYALNILFNDMVDGLNFATYNPMLVLVNEQEGFIEGTNIPQANYLVPLLQCCFESPHALVEELILRVRTGYRYRLLESVLLLDTDTCRRALMTTAEEQLLCYTDARTKPFSDNLKPLNESFYGSHEIAFLTVMSRMISTSAHINRELQAGVTCSMDPLVFGGMLTPTGPYEQKTKRLSESMVDVWAQRIRENAKMQVQIICSRLSSIDLRHASPEVIGGVIGSAVAKYHEEDSMNILFPTLAVLWHLAYPDKNIMDAISTLRRSGDLKFDMEVMESNKMKITYGSYFVSVPTIFGMPYMNSSCGMEGVDNAYFFMIGFQEDNAITEFDFEDAVMGNSVLCSILWAQLIASKPSHVVLRPELVLSFLETLTRDFIEPNRNVYIDPKDDVIRQCLRKLQHCHNIVGSVFDLVAELDLSNTDAATVVGLFTNLMGFASMFSLTFEEGHLEVVRKFQGLFEARFVAGYPRLSDIRRKVALCFDCPTIISSAFHNIEHFDYFLKFCDLHVSKEVDKYEFETAFEKTCLILRYLLNDGIVSFDMDMALKSLDCLQKWCVKTEWNDWNYKVDEIRLLLGWALLMELKEITIVQPGHGPLTHIHQILTPDPDSMNTIYNVEYVVRRAMLSDYQFKDTSKNGMRKEIYNKIFDFAKTASKITHKEFYSVEDEELWAVHLYALMKIYTRSHCMPNLLRLCLVDWMPNMIGSKKETFIYTQYCYNEEYVSQYVEIKNKIDMLLKS